MQNKELDQFTFKSYLEEEVLLKAQQAKALQIWVRNTPEPTIAYSPLEIAQIKQTGRYAKRRAEFLESQRHQPHTWSLLCDLFNARAVRQWCLWRTFPINNLPVEILAQILEHTLTVPLAEEVMNARQTLCSVCPLWRSVVINTPRMWSVVCCTSPFPFLPIRDCLERSKYVKLSVTIDYRQKDWSHSEKDYGTFSPEHMSALMDLLVPGFARISELYLLADTWTVMFTALRRLKHIAVPSLKLLEVHRTGPAYVQFGRGQTPPDLHNPIVLFDGKAPALRHVVLNGVHVNWTRSPLRDLLTLGFRKMAVEVMPTLKEFRAAVRGCPNLMHLSFEGAGPQWLERLTCSCKWGKKNHGHVPYELQTFFPHQKDAENEECDCICRPPIELHQLQDLIMGDFAIDYMLYLLKLFSAPKVKRLRISNLTGINYPTLMEKLKGLFPLTTVLAVGNVEAPQNLVEAWLESLPNVRYFKLSGSEAFLKALLISKPIEGSDQVSVLCPYLDTIESDNTDVDTLISFVEQRKALGYPLSQLLVPKDRQNTLSKEEFRKLSTTGILALIPYGSRPDLKQSYLETALLVPGPKN